MDEDGIDATMLYPNLSLFIYWTDDHELSMAHARVYNDHLIERILPYKARMRPACPIPLTDVGDAVAEIERVARAGLGAILLPAVPPVPYYSPELDPVWAAAQANRLPVFFHGFTGGVKVGEPNSEMMKQITMAGEMGTVTLDERSAANRSNASQSMKGAPIVTDLVSGGVPERFPDLHFNLIEFNANWLTRLMGGMDKAWTTGIGQDKDFWGGYWDSSRPASDQPKMARIFNVNSKWPHPLKPSEYIKRQFHVSFQDDPAAVGCRSYTGISTLVWGNDYPHAEGTFRGSRELIPELFAGVPDDERAAILGGTMAEVVGFDRAAAVRHAVTPRDN
jgi:predicted TIM-barrel fold metal-dependent hydrolase